MGAHRAYARHFITKDSRSSFTIVSKTFLRYYDLTGLHILCRCTVNVNLIVQT